VVDEELDGDEVEDGAAERVLEQAASVSVLSNAAAIVPR
jgi:hypothetical protein